MTIRNDLPLSEVPASLKEQSSASLRALPGYFV